MDHSAILERPPSAGGALLGNTAKSSSTAPEKTAKAKQQAKRAQRFAALSQAREWLGERARSIDPKRFAGDVYRTVDCRWAQRAEYVGVHFSAQHQAAHYGNVATCGSVWACPVCAAKIQQRRREELAQLVEWSYSRPLVLDREAVGTLDRDGQPVRVVSSAIGPELPYQPSMVTLTFPHTAFDTLGDLIARQREAFKRLRSGRAWVALMKWARFGGLVRSLELTHGGNGWHPHTHELWLIRYMDVRDQAVFRVQLVELWEKACVAVGLLDPADKNKVHAFRLHAVDVRHGVTSSDYLAKQDSARAWGVDHEMASASSKQGRLSGVHPHEFLVRQADGDRERYMEYVDGMKGSRQLFWSPGLKALVGVDEKADEELAEEQTEAADCLGLLTGDQWKVVRGNDARAELLDAAERGGWSAVQWLLRSLGCELVPLPVDPSG